MTTELFFSRKIASILAIEPRIQWFLIEGIRAIDQNTLWADEKVAKYARLIDGMVSPITQQGRDLRAVSIQIAATTHLIVALRQLRICFILPSTKPKHLDQIANEALDLLHEYAAESQININPAPASEDATPSLPTDEPAVEAPIETPEIDPLAWPEFRQFLIECIGKILSRPQAERLLDRQLANLNLPTAPEPAQFEQIGRSLVAHIPHRGKQAALLTEVLHYLES